MHQQRTSRGSRRYRCTPVVAEVDSSRRAWEHTDTSRRHSTATSTRRMLSPSVCTRECFREVQRSFRSNAVENLRGGAPEVHCSGFSVLGFTIGVLCLGIPGFNFCLFTPFLRDGMPTGFDDFQKLVCEITVYIAYHPLAYSFMLLLHC